MVSDLIQGFHDWTIEGIAIGENTLELIIRSEQNERKLLRFEKVARFVISEVLRQNVIYRFVVVDEAKEPALGQQKRELLHKASRFIKGDPKKIAFIEASVGAELIVEFDELTIHSFVGGSSR